MIDLPLEPEVLRRERRGLPPLEDGQLKELQDKARAGGWWGINTPEEYGGIALGPVMSAIVAMENGRTFVPFRFGGTADNILYAGTDEQKQQYLIPTINGERRSCFAITEPGARSDARNIRTRAVRDGTDWVITGEKSRRRGYLLPGRPGQGLEVRADPDDGRVGPGRARLRGRPGARAEHPGQVADPARRLAAVDRVLQIHGGMGYTKELPVERWYRELRLLRIFEGTDEIQRRTIARNLIKGHVKLGELGD